MKFSVLQENFKKALSAINNITNKQVNLPILNGVLIKAQKQGIKILATNLEIGMVYNIRGKVEKEGEVVVEAKTLSNLIAFLPNQRINFIKKEKNFIIETDNYLTKLNYQNTEEFPIIPQIKKNNEYEIENKELQQALTQVLFAVGSDNTKIELSGVLLEFKEKEIICVGTNGFRLAEKKITNFAKSSGKNLKIIIPAKTIQEVLRVISLSDSNENNLKTKIQINENQIQFLINSTRIVSRLIEGQFPDYKQIIPNNYKTRCLVNKTELIQAIKTTSLFSKEKLNDINLKILKNNSLLTISSSNQKGESVVRIKTKITGEDNNLSVNYHYFLDGLSNIEDNEVIIEFINNNTPCVLKPPTKKDYIYLVMPLKS